MSKECCNNCSNLHYNFNAKQFFCRTLPIILRRTDKKYFLRAFIYHRYEMRCDGYTCENVYNRMRRQANEKLGVYAFLYEHGNLMIDRDEWNDYYDRGGE